MATAKKTKERPGMVDFKFNGEKEAKIMHVSTAKALEAHKKGSIVK